MNTSHNQTQQPATKPAHTPTPWVVSKQYRSETIMQPQYWDVCTSRKDGHDTILETVAENCSEADAKLLATAPELFAELARCSDMLESVIQTLGKHLDYDTSYSSSVLIAARAALAKAQA